MDFLHQIRFFVWPVFLVLAMAVTASAQSVTEMDFPFNGQTDVTVGILTASEPGIHKVASTDSLTPPVITALDSRIVVMEYQSVFDVHTQRDEINYPNIRSQPGFFDQPRILSDLERVVDPSNYDFVLLYSIRELPGWIHSGYATGRVAKNIGFANESSGPDKLGYGHWSRLRSVPHMNSIDYLGRTGADLMPNYASTLTAFHEMYHCWGVFITVNSNGPREWKPTDPLAYLVAGYGHWSWVWSDSLPPGKMPGMMYSGPLSTRYNAYDLYIMGLMDYDEAKQYTYGVYDLEGNKYQMHLDSLIHALYLAGPTAYQGDGRRIPATDPLVKKLRTLVVVVKGKDDALYDAQKKLILKLVNDIPADWSAATWGRSEMEVALDKKPTFGINDLPASGPGEGIQIHAIPNPAKSCTAIEFSLSETQYVKLTLFNAMGQHIETLVSGKFGPGLHQTVWNASAYPDGLYFYRIETLQHSLTQKLLLQK